MKRIIFVLVTLISLIAFSATAESYGDIVVYVVPSHAERQIRDFQNSIDSPSRLFKSGSDWVLVVKSKGYGLDYREYKLYSLKEKHVIAQGSSDYYNYNKYFK